MNIDELYERATGHAPFPFQVAFAEADALPDVLAVPTGAGKTATVVIGWLWRRRFGSVGQRTNTPRRLVFCLPMRALVDQTESVARTWIERLGLGGEVSVHTLQGGSVDSSFDDAPEREAVLIGTQDQLLSRALNRGFGMSRFRWPVHFAWLNSDVLWVMDEVQLMGVGVSTAAQLQAFREQLGAARPAHTLWMSATMPEAKLRTVDFQRPLARAGLGERDIAHPVLAQRLSAKKTLSLAESAFDPKSGSRLAAEVLAAHVPGTLTIAVVNRVARAQSLAAGLRAQAKRTSPGLDIRLVHGRFRPADRKAMELGALERGFDGILVATQAIEAGVDISARTLFTELAPWSSLVQRFGRCNRSGEHADARVIWLDIPDDHSAPYSPEQLQQARERVRACTEVGPSALPVFGDESAPEVPVLRKRDLLELFDTSADLAGCDVDISRFVRSSDADRDVQIAWRTWEGDVPPANLPALARDELCRAPLGDAQKLLKNADAFRWDSLEGAWARVDAKRLVPGMTLLVDAAVGGYTESLGFTGDSNDRPRPFPVQGDGADHDESDMLTLGASRYVALAEHSNDAAEELAILESQLGGNDPWPLLARAARAHDLGKAHPAFQAMLVAALDDGDPRRHEGPWAKSDGLGGGKHIRRHFRHELASALARLDEGADDLEVFLIAAHHGKVRLALRARPDEHPPRGVRAALGVWDGDELPAVDLGGGVSSRATTLSLDVMELGEGANGASWSTRMIALRDAHGPFRLAFWEALVRVADWRATRRHVSTAPTDPTRRGTHD